jgi:hypothetical protein
MQPQEIDVTKHTRDEYVRQARARVGELRELQAGIEAQKQDAPRIVQEDLDTCALDIEAYIMRAEDEIDLLEHAEERDWIAMRGDVDIAIGEAQREVEVAHELLSNPYARVRSAENMPRPR